MNLDPHPLVGYIVGLLTVAGLAFIGGALAMLRLCAWGVIPFEQDHEVPRKDGEP
jgi:hypothetical protein